MDQSVTKYNRHISRKVRIGNPGIDENRNSGRTTSIAMRMIADALVGTVVEGRDHHEPGQYYSCAVLTRRIESIIEALDLHYLTVHLVNNIEDGDKTVRIVNSMFTTNPWEIE